MLIIDDTAQLNKILTPIYRSQSVIGLVPTMGALHDGHMSLVYQSKKETDFTVVSIFVNPLQFNNEKDLIAYPRNLKEDFSKLKQANVDLIFCPDASVFYLKNPKIMLNFGLIEKNLEGYYRPGHFNGMGIVIAKLFHLINPDKAYFGLKDLQQYFIIKRLVEDLSFKVQIVGVSTARAANGLALSSRNKRLSEKGIHLASKIYKGLLIGEKAIKRGDLPQLVISSMTSFFSESKDLKLEYCKVVETENFEPIETYDGLLYVAICVAAYVEEVRLIDNLYLHLR